MSWRQAAGRPPAHEPDGMQGFGKLKRLHMKSWLHSPGTSGFTHASHGVLFLSKGDRVPELFALQPLSPAMTRGKCRQFLVDRSLAR